MKSDILPTYGVTGVRALMVDVDGVLVTGRPEDGRHWASSVDADLGLELVDLQAGFFALHWESIITGKYGLTETLDVVLPKIAPHLTSRDLIDYWFAKDARLNEALLSQLDRLRGSGVRVFLASNQEHLRARYLIETLGLGERCDGIFYSAALGYRKPDRRFFKKAAALAGASPGEIVLLDDLIENVLAAHESGWRAVHWQPDSVLFRELEKLQASMFQ